MICDNTGEQASHTAIGHGDRDCCMSERWRASMPMMQLMDRIAIDPPFGLIPTL